MSKVRLTMLGLLVVYALSVVLAPSASAATPEWWVEGKVLTGTEKVSEETKATGEAVLKSTGINVGCATVAVEGGSIGAKNEDTLNAVVFTKCTVVSPSGCEVAKIKSEPLVFPLEESGSVIKLNFRPKSGTLIAAITVTGSSCTAKGTVDVTVSGEKGGMDCNYPGVETESLEHTLEFTKTSGSSFKIGSLTGELIANFKWKLASKKLFSALS